MNNQIVLGSGNLYIMELPANGTIPTDEVIETSANRIGYIKGGASLEYKPTELEIKDDSNVFINRYVTATDVTFKSGILTWDLGVLAKLTAECTYSDNTNTGIRTLLIGKAGAAEMKKYIIRFVHEKNALDSIKITLVGTASEGFSLAFAKDEETTIDAEFKAISQDASGTQIKITETYSVSGGNQGGDGEDEE